MIRGTKGKMFILLAALVLSLTFAGLASAATPKTIKKDGMELVHLRQAADMYGYSVKWDAKEKSVTLIYSGKMMDDKMMDNKMMDNKMTDNKMTDNKMTDDKMTDDKMMDNKMTDNKMTDNKMTDNKMMDNSMKQGGKTIKLWIGSKKITVDGNQVKLDSAPVLYRNNTYVTAALVTKYLKPASMME
ncbi:copper amine oxidase N-terminal domain-containing protein [Cohnella endophytica]|uniref:Copper amine oxidase N-terminal domain-containing protein n=1 Tax=Cohnella endophytica TaxID=2419778 RepID=A0A494Y7Y0_9BACL|nr:stalk domain-containing protein [Cohnella endophytica]RKP58193.1 copper amine oxidase N-terminal domain-containing protein [Cohnella endophytica]